jgi:hypothetical protein
MIGRRKKDLSRRRRETARHGGFTAPPKEAPCLASPPWLRERIVAAVLLAFLLPATALAEDPPQYDYDAEIKRKKAELKRVAKQLAEVKAATKQDAAEFQAYKARTKQRAMGIIKQTTEIQKSTGEFRSKHGRLGAIIGSHKRKVRGYEARQKNFTARLTQHCDSLIATAKGLSPMLSTKAVAALDYLKSELTGGSTDNIEGLHRLVRIARQMDAQLMDIQVSQGSSPVPQITGTCHRIRLGGVFEAVVKGESAAVWDFNTGKWRLLNDPATAKMILAAVEVRSGKKKPALVKLPLVSRAVSK